jgi:hypothetical protein
MERNEDRLAALVHIHHGIQQGIDNEMRSIVLHAVELGAVRLDAVEHAVDDPGDAFLKLLDPAGRKCRQQQASDTSMLLAIHLRDELGKHDLIELLSAGTARHLGFKGFGVRKYAMHVGVAADNHLWRAIPKHTLMHHNLLQVLRLAPELLDLIGRRSPLCRLCGLGFRTLDRERQLLHVQRRTDVMKVDAMARILENGRIDRGRRR